MALRRELIAGLLEGARVADEINKVGGSAGSVAVALRKMASDIDQYKLTQYEQRLIDLRTQND
jgi:hypothetical protein